MLAKLAPVRGARFVATLTGFKWLMRADEAAVLAPEPAAQLAIGQPTGGVATDPHLVYAYEEALGMAVDPDAVRDKDGIGAALLFCDLASRLADEGSSLALRLDELAVEFGVHADRQRSLTLTPDEASAWMQCLREHPPTELAGEPAQVYDLDTLTGRLQTDAVLIRSDSARVVVRPSGTEPKIKLYFEVVEPVSDAAALSGARERAEHRLDALAKLAD